MSYTGKTQPINNVAKHASETLAPNGSVLLVEPMAGNTVEENFNPIGRTFAAASTLCCTANSLARAGLRLALSHRRMHCARP